jgi:hypothetical protein
MAIQDTIKRLAAQWRSGGVTDSVEDFDPIESALGVPLPADYKFFLMELGEGEADLPGGYLRVYPLGEIPSRQEPALSNVVVFGSDGGDHGFGFDAGSRTDTATYRIVEFPTSTTDPTEVEVVADSFDAFLKARSRRSA